MKKPCFLAALLLISTLTLAETAPKKSKVSQKPATNAAPGAIIYKPAAGSALGARVTGGSRGSGDAAVRLDVLAPDETGLTTQEQPSLFWYQSKPAQASFELTLLEEGKIKPVLQVKMDRSSNAGIQRIKLAEHGIKLAVGVEYRWVVALVLDPANRSNDLIASGFVERVEPSKELQEKLAKATPSTRPAIYAQAGIWHDALASLSDLIDAQPNAEKWRAERADLLRQVGLKFAADAESMKPKS
jgi:hypothetical protein